MSIIIFIICLLSMFVIISNVCQPVCLTSEAMYVNSMLINRITNCKQQYPYVLMLM